MKSKPHCGTMLVVWPCSGNEEAKILHLVALSHGKHTLFGIFFRIDVNHWEKKFGYLVTCASKT